MARRNRPTPSELCDKYHGDPYYLERRGSKWYVKKQEVKNIKKWLATGGDFDTAREVIDFIDMFTMKYGEEDAEWYPLPIIEEARAQLRTEGLLPLSFPLNEEQLIIIRVLLEHNLERAFILTGIGGSGKSTFANIICQIFDNDRASVSISDLGDKFVLEEAIQHRLVYSDELNSDDLNNGKLKILISNQRIQVQQKNQQPYNTKCQSAFLWSCNVRPRIDLNDSGMLRRFVYYSMNKKIEHPDPRMKDMTYGHDELVNFVAHALSVDMTDWFERHFEKQTHFYLLKDNTVFRFRKDGNGNETTYVVYVMHCNENGYKHFALDKWQDIMNLIREWGMMDINEKEYEECLRK